jgi:N-acetylmuramoyl-L-alanine amidase
LRDFALVFKIFAILTASCENRQDSQPRQRLSSCFNPESLAVQNIHDISKEATMLEADVLIQAGHEGRKTGATGAEGPLGREIEWTPIVANRATATLRAAGLSVIRKNATLAGNTYAVKIAVFIHFDGSDPPCKSGASVGYDDADRPAADAWRALYDRHWPFTWRPDNFTVNLRQYYGFQYTKTSDAELVLELGEITCREQALWLKPRLEWIGDLLAHFISARLGMGNVPDPGDFDA